MNTKFYYRNPLIVDPGKKISKKIVKKFKKLKNLFPTLFFAKREEIGREGEKRILLPNSVHTRLGQENSEKKSKNIEKIKKPLSDIIFSQNGDEIGRKCENKILLQNSVFTRSG